MSLRPDGARRGDVVCFVRQRACSAALVANYLERMRIANTTLPLPHNPNNVKTKVLLKAREYTRLVVATSHLPSGTPLLGVRPYKITQLFTANCPTGVATVPTVSPDGELGAFTVQKLQVILVEATQDTAPLTRPTDITAGFDIDVCGVSFDVRADALGLRALSFAFDAGLEAKLAQQTISPSLRPTAFAADAKDLSARGGSSERKSKRALVHGITRQLDRLLKYEQRFAAPLAPHPCGAASLP